MRVVIALACLFLCAEASALTGKAPPASGVAGRAIVMLVDRRENLCTATAIAPDLVLTAAHCVMRKDDYQVQVSRGGAAVAAKFIATHPGFDARAYLASRATADVALVKLEAPLPAMIVPAALAAPRSVNVGDRLIIAGFGVTAARSNSGLGTPRMAALAVTGRPGNLQIRLIDPATAGSRPGQFQIGLGACTGDSGGPAFDGDAVIGVVSWSTAPQLEEGCGGMTGVTPLGLYRPWITDQARKFGSPIGP
ncbi:MAG: trypsin-like serine protease [Pseudolabrys sp.]|nr:trypsin-like serine protease [Pseudolabrys sp.]